VVQVWVDPAYPRAHRDLRFRTWLAKSAETTGMAAVIRGGMDDGLILAPPAITANGKWQEQRANLVHDRQIGLWENNRD
jgi:hypothetical protein